MSEEQKSSESASEPKPNVVQIRVGEYEGLKTQLSKLQREAEERAKADELGRTEREQKEAEERKAYSEALSKKESAYRAQLAERENELASLRRGMVERDLKFGLVSAGLSPEDDAFVIKGILADYFASDEKERKEPDEFLKELRKSHAKLFEKQKQQAPPPSGGQPSASKAGKGGTYSIFDPRFAPAHRKG